MENEKDFSFRVDITVRAKTVNEAYQGIVKLMQKAPDYLAFAVEACWDDDGDIDDFREAGK